MSNSVRNPGRPRVGWAPFLVTALLVAAFFPAALLAI
jgi:hypothetical protein